MIDNNIFFGLVSQNRNGSDLPTDATTDNLPEGKFNLYFTKERVAKCINAKDPLYYDYEAEQFSIQKATRIDDGYLAKADFRTFSDKADKGTYSTSFSVITDVNFDTKTVTKKTVTVTNGYIVNVS